MANVNGSYILPCEPYEIEMYDLDLGRRINRTVAGYIVRVVDDATMREVSAFGIRAIPLRAGRFLIAQEKVDL